MPDLRTIFGVEKPLIAMCHLEGLPGRPRYDTSGGMERVVESAARELAALQDGGVDAVMFCNENDIPYSTAVGVEAAAAMAAVIGRLHSEIRVPYGVNLLWDARATIAVAAATGASFVREVFMGVFESDMGLLAPDYGEVAGYRHAIGADDVAILTNITPEFSRSVGGRSVAERAASAAYMGVEGLLISGAAAGVGASLDEVREAKAAAPERPVLANTGVTHETVEEVLRVADGAVVGTSLKVDGLTWNHVDPDRVAVDDGEGQRGTRQRGRAGSPMARRIRIYFATDVHGSEKCFRKFLNGAAVYQAGRADPRRGHRGEGDPGDRGSRLRPFHDDVPRSPLRRRGRLRARGRRAAHLRSRLLPMACPAGRARGARRRRHRRGRPRHS